MDGSRADPFALQIAAELAASTDGNRTHDNTHASANDNDDKRRGGNSAWRGGGQRWQAQEPLEDLQRLATHGSQPSPARGRDATSVSAALHDAVLRWGAPTERRRYGVGAAGGGIPLSSRNGVYGAGEASPLSSSASPLCVRYSWTLVEAQHRRSVRPPPTTPGDQKDAGLNGGDGATPAWSIGQRWVRHDSMLCDTALLAALQKGVSTDSPPHQQDPQHALYAKGLRMCGEGLRRGVSLPAFVAAVGSLESSAAAGHELSFFTFTREEYEALTPPSPLPPRVSAEADGGPACAASPFSYASSCLLMQLWQRYGNPVVVVDRWAAMVAQRHSPSPHAPLDGRFSLSVSATPHTSILHQSATRSGEPSLLSLVPAWVPTVEQACTEYARVTAGVLQLRRQRLLDALAAQHAQQQQQKKHAQRQNHDVDDNSRGSTCLQDPRSSSRHQAAAENVPAILHTPLVTAFDKYALLHCAKNSANRDSREGDDTHDGNHAQSTQQQQQLANELASQPSPPSSGPRVTASPTPQPSVSAATTILQEQAHAVTPQQQLVELTTPSPWYLYDAEVSRRASVTALLSSEQATNVPYQRCATRYLRLVVSAAQAMQRAATLYDDRDRDAPDAAAEDDQPDEGSSTSHHAAEVADHEATTQSSEQGRSAAPPRAAFVAALRSLPNIDPAAWRSAEAAVRKAAAEVLQSAAAAGLKPRPPHRGARQRMDDAVVPQRKRGRPRSSVPAGVARRSRQAPKVEKHSSAVVKYEEKEEEEQEEADEEEEGDGALPDGSREASWESSSRSSSSNGRREDGTKSRSGSAKSDSDHSSSSSSDNGGEGEEEDDDDESGGEEVERDGSASPDRQNNEEEEEDAEEAVTDKRTTTTPTERRNRKAKPKPLSENSRPAKASRVRRSSPSSPVSAAAQVPPLHSDTTYREMSDYVHDVIPFLCARLSAATQAGWLLPPPPPLPRTLTSTLSDGEVATMQIHARRPSLLPAVVTPNTAERSAVVGESTQAVQTTTASPPSFSFHEEEDPLRPILTDAVYHDLRAINAAAVCNRVVSHTSEAVLLSLPAAVPRLHREVEQELERYLYDDTSAMMEMTPTAQHLLAAIRVVYTQNTCLQRYLTRLEHVAENLEKVVQECKEAMASGTETL